MTAKKDKRLIILMVNYGTKEYMKELIKNFLFSLPKFAEIRIDWILTDATDAFEIDRDDWENEMRETFKNQKNNYFYFFRIPNRGFAHNVNLSYQLLKRKLGDNFSVGEDDLILLLNPDTSFYWQSLARALRFMEENREATVAGMALCSPKGAPEKWGHSLTFPSLKLIWGRKRFSEPSGALEPTEVSWVSGGAMLIRLSWWERLKGLDEGFFLYFEDVDFCRRVKVERGKVFFLPQATVSHRRGASDINIYRRKQHFYASEAKYFYLWRNGTEYLLLRLVRIPFKIFYFCKGYLAPSFWKKEWQKFSSEVACEREKGFPRIICSVKRFVQTPWMLAGWIAVLVLNLLLWGVAFWGRKTLGSPIILHYNSYLGVDFYGDSDYFLIFPTLGLLVFLFNFVLCLVLFFSKKYSALSIVASGASLGFQTAILIALVNLIFVNR